MASRRHVTGSWLLCVAAVLAVAAPASAFDIGLGGSIDFYPFPTFKSDRNEGNTYGGVLVFLGLNKEHEIEHVIAPFLQWNEFTGWEGGLLAFGNPSNHQEYKVDIDWSQHVDRDIKLSYVDHKFLDGKYDIGGSFEYDRQGTNRFFGVGPGTDKDDETNYADRDLQVSLQFGLNLGENLTVGVAERFRNQSVSPGTVTDLPFLGASFPSLRGRRGTESFATGLYMTYDTRDNSETPTQGEYLSVGASGVAGLAKDTPDFEHYSLDARKFIPFGDDRRFVLVLRGKVELESGPLAPFAELSTIGGDTSLRAFGDDRFADRHSWLLNFEQRIRIWRTKIFGYPIELEGAPFVDIGSVFSGAGNIGQNVQVNPGFALRLLSRPNVVGGMNLSWGQDGFLITGGFSFPF